MNTHKITTGHWRPTMEGEDLHTETCEYVLLKDHLAVVVEKDAEIARLRDALGSVQKYAKMIGNQAIVFVVSKALEK